MSGRKWELSGDMTIPEQIDGIPVTAIARKEFLGCRMLRRITLPRTIREVGDWAFAHCANLTDVRWSGAAGTEPEISVRFGKAVFAGCRNLRLLYAQDGRESTAALLAAAATVMNADYLLELEAVGKPEWLAAWDARMRTILRTPDDEGFSSQMVCGEEDVGNSDQAAYESEQRCAKVRLLLLRLLYPDGLDGALRAEAQDYLLGHTAGCPHDEAWRVILREHGDDPAWYRLFAELGCVTAENLDVLLTDIGEEHPEMKAYFLRRGMDGGDFFAALTL